MPSTTLPPGGTIPIVPIVFSCALSVRGLARTPSLFSQLKLNHGLLIDLPKQLTQQPDFLLPRDAAALLAG